MSTLMYLLFVLLTSVLITIGMGHCLARIFHTKHTHTEGTQTHAQNDWQRYAKQFLLVNAICACMGFLILSFQHLLPFNPLGLPGMDPLQAFNTAASFITNTNWQSYSGEVSLSLLSQMMAICFLQVVGASSGIAVCLAFLRGLTQRPLGDFYHDFLKITVFIFLPFMMIGGLFFMSQGVPQTLHQQVTIRTLENHTQHIALGPVASMLTLKQLGTNGGGFFNANAAHPFENPNPLTNHVQILMALALPMGLIYLFGLWLKDKKQAWLIWGSMMMLFMILLGIGLSFEQSGNPILSSLPGLSIDQTPSLYQSGGNMEGKEVRFGIVPSTLFTVATTATSTGAVNTMHDSLTPIGGLVPLVGICLNVIFGGVGVGLMGFILYGLFTVFLTGLMVGRTPEIFGKKIGKAEIILASIAILIRPMLILVPSAISAVTDFGLGSLNNLGPHGLTEIVYAFGSAAANNGSAFAGLNANTPWYNISLGSVMLLGRYLSIIALLAISGSLLSKPKIDSGVGTLKTNTLLFSVLWVSIILIIGALTFVPMLILGPVAEHIAMLSGTLF